MSVERARELGKEMTRRYYETFLESYAAKFGPGYEELLIMLRDAPPEDRSLLLHAFREGCGHDLFAGQVEPDNPLYVEIFKKRFGVTPIEVLNWWTA